jgi:hypothetical protein
LRVCMPNPASPTNAQGPGPMGASHQGRPRTPRGSPGRRHRLAGGTLSGASDPRKDGCALGY